MNPTPQLFHFSGSLDLANLTLTRSAAALIPGLLIDRERFGDLKSRVCNKKILLIEVFLLAPPPLADIGKRWFHSRPSFGLERREPYGCQSRYNCRRRHS